MEKNIESPAALEASLVDLHTSVARLIKAIQSNAGSLNRSQEILDKLPLLDFYNDDLLRNIKTIRKHVIAIQAKRNCGRVTNRGEEPWSENAGRRTETGYEALFDWIETWYNVLRRHPFIGYC